MERSERKATRIRVATDNQERSRTKQDGYRDANINNIVATYGRTGMWSNVNPRAATYGDVSEMLELEQALELVNHANREFMALPAHVRALAGNDPVRLLGMLADPTHVELLKAAGLPFKEPVVGETPQPENPPGDPA
jgi:phage internal scaffolding protein